MHGRRTVLRYFRSRTARAPWGARLFAAALTLSLVFVLTPCCEVAGAALSDVHATPGHGPVDDHPGGGHAPDGGDPCAARLDRSDALAGKTDNLVSFDGKAALGAPTLTAPPAVSPSAPGARLAHLPIPPPDALYLRHARLIL